MHRIEPFCLSSVWLPLDSWIRTNCDRAPWRLKPPLPKTGADCKHLDYVGNRISLAITGRAQPVPCAGDAGPFADPAHSVLLRYGKTWGAGGLTCSEKTSGLTCKNRDGHGFFMSLRSWRTF